MFDPISIILPGEAPAFLPDLITAARSFFQPANGFERSVVDNITILHYRLRRMAVLECGLLRFQRILTPGLLIRNWRGIDEAGHNTLAAVRMRNKLRDFLGLETSLSRLFHQALKTLELIRKIVNPAPGNARKTPVQNKPNLRESPAELALQVTPEPIRW